MNRLQYDIVATLGPSTETRSFWEKLVDAGVSTFRLNVSHLTQSKLNTWLERLDPFLSSLDIKLVLDLQGSKWRLGDFQPYNLVNGQQIEFVFAENTQHPGILPVPHLDFFEAADIAFRHLVPDIPEIELNDARSKMKILSVAAENITARVIQGGGITPRKGVNLASPVYRKEGLSLFDQTVFMATRNIPYIQYALSYVKDAIQMKMYRSVLGASTSLVAKIERQSAINDLDKIASYTDALWICRGDLGAELGLMNMANEVNSISQKVKELPIPVLIAGQMFEHMTEHPEPTRSEICYWYDALICGYRGIILSDETAIGQYPVEACEAAALFG